jgi:transposase
VTTTTSMSEASGQPRVIVGVDTHKDTHVAVAVDDVGGLLGSASFSADRARYQALIA